MRGATEASACKNVTVAHASSERCKRRKLDNQHQNSEQNDDRDKQANRQLAVVGLAQQRPDPSCCHDEAACRGRGGAKRKPLVGSRAWSSLRARGDPALLQHRRLWLLWRCALSTLAPVVFSTSSSTSSCGCALERSRRRGIKDPNRPSRVVVPTRKASTPLRAHNINQLHQRNASGAKLRRGFRAGAPR